MIYNLIAPIYDEINNDIDYSEWADFIEKNISVHSSFTRGAMILDLGCGTGKMLVELAKRGYDMTGVDYSFDMLDIARNSVEQNDLDNVLLLCQDMCSFELYGTVDVIISCLDCVNHIVDRKELAKCFDLVHNYLVPDGLFIFDINGRAKFENVYADNAYVMESDGSMCVWQNHYNKNTKICDFYITLFTEAEDGSYNRYDEMQKEKMYTIRSLKKLLLENGMDFIGAYSDFDFKSADDSDDRIYIVAKCVKD